MKKILSLFATLSFYGTLCAGQSDAKVYDPSVASALGSAPTPGSSFLISVIYLVFLAGLAWAVYLFWRKRSAPCRTTRSQARILDVTATRPLGNRQFLVVVRYGKKELLLGVGQGFITPLQSDDCPDTKEFKKKGA